MREEEFQILFYSIEENLKNKKHTLVVNQLRSLFDELTPNDLSVYRTLKSIENDILNGKDNEFIEHSITELLKSVKSKRLSKRERLANFIVSVMTFTLIPAFPFITKWMSEMSISPTDLILAMAVYCTSISISIDSMAEKMGALILSILVCLLVKDNPNNIAIGTSVFITIAICSMHITDRVKRHLFNHEPYLKK